MRDVRKSQFIQQSTCKTTWHKKPHQNEKDTTQGHQRGGASCQELSHISDLALLLPVLSADRCAPQSALWDNSCELLQEISLASKEVLLAEERAQHFSIPLWFCSDGAVLFCYFRENGTHDDFLCFFSYEKPRRKYGNFSMLVLKSALWISSPPGTCCSQLESEMVRSASG